MATELLAHTHQPSYTRGDDALAIIDTYRQRVEDEVRVEPLDREFPYYAHVLGHSGVYLAHFEDNVTGSFKWRGAVVGAHTLVDQGATKLLVPSAGNHVRGAVWAARQLQVPVTAVVPSSAPPKKQHQVRELWDDPRLTMEVRGATFDESLDWALEQGDGTMLHPYGPEVQPGQGTIVDDILAARPDVQTIIAPIGGSGLVAGMLARLAELGRYDIMVVGAEAEGSNSLRRSILAGELRQADRPNKRYGGSAVHMVSESAFEVCNLAPNFGIISVPDEDVDELIDCYDTGRRELIREATPNLEPTSLVAVAALRQYTEHKVTVVVGTGQNDTLYPEHAPTAKKVWM